ncbi:MAG TPA: asparagine synthase (glutamine-hydrolyzing) [Gaiellaceae bacterium]|nr:asparagine synthase (glutamine-hydrolyzing) [Gaiellaceae bacterium]
MCGIVGVARAPGGPKPDRALLERAIVALHHRGPDGSGSHVTPNVGLGHTRLSIIDIDGGVQPMANEDGTVWTVYNGEIWNFADLRAQLLAAGHTFATRCDTEVLVHGYEEWGDDLVPRLNGMFAFAIWDDRRERLLLARDRIGKKPLYVSQTGDGLAFGSDVRSLLLASGASPRLNEDALAEFLFQRYVCAPRTLFEGVERLPAGHLLVYERGAAEVRPYWSLPRDARPEVLDPRDLRALLLDSVRLRLMSDVPLGVFLSGGVDSAAVLGLMREAGAGTVASFTIGFDDPVFDERPRARLTAERFGSDHHEVVVGADDFVDALPRLAWYRDEPIAEAAEIPLLLLSEFAGRQVKVVLSGEGGDELFGGYPKYRAERLLGLPTAAPRLALRVAGEVAVRRRSHRQLQRALETLEIRDPLLRWASWFRAFSVADLQRVLAPELRATASPASLTRPLAERLAPFAHLDAPRQMLVGDLQSYLPDNMLLRGDRVLMAGSIEGRMPLLDYRVIERVCRAPVSQRASWLRSKKVLRQALADVIPDEIQRGPKRGFPVPVARFLLEGRARLADRLVLSERALDRGLFDRGALTSLVDQARASRFDSQLRLFTLASLELWLRTNVDELTTRPPDGLEQVLEPREREPQDAVAG